MIFSWNMQPKILENEKITLYIFLDLNYCYKVLNQGENYERYIRKKTERLYGGTDR